MQIPKIIQGGMGISISDWYLAKTVSMTGQLGVISGTGLHITLIARLMDGDREGNVRRALDNFPFQEPVKKILDKYFVPYSGKRKTGYKRPQMWGIKPTNSINELTVIANFVEVFLAKENHKNAVGINFLEKIQLPTLASIYGAMLAGVNYIFMGAGIPMQIPAIIEKLSNHEDVNYKLDVTGSSKEDDFRINFEPGKIFPEIREKIGNLCKPYFVPIISSVVLAKALLKRASGKIDGFIIENSTAGGHNAPPRSVSAEGKAVYGAKDEVDLQQIKEIGLPFWLAGDYYSHEKFLAAIEQGAAGVQVGTPFAFCNESGMDPEIRKSIIEKIKKDSIEIVTDFQASPTGFPFKVVQHSGSVTDKDVYNERCRICDIGLLRQAYKKEDGEVGFRCSAEPEDAFISKGGKAEELEGTVCLCNNLFATAGMPQIRKDGYTEPPVVTSGDALNSIKNNFLNGCNEYSASDVIDLILGKKTKSL